MPFSWHPASALPSSLSLKMCICVHVCGGLPRPSSSRCVSCAAAANACAFCACFRAVCNSHEWVHSLACAARSTTLAGDDTESNVKRLCFKAKNAVQQDIMKDLELEDLKITTGCAVAVPLPLPLCSFPSATTRSRRCLLGPADPTVANRVVASVGSPTQRPPIAVQLLLKLLQYR
jgi:hypothetical protein